MEIIPALGFSDPFSSWTHLIAAMVAFIGGFYLCYRGRGNGARITAFVIFTFSLVFLFSMSGTYHLLDKGGLAREVLARLDHAAIFVLIAGTFTPVHIILFRGAWRWGILLLVWSLCITCLVLKVVFFNDIPEWMGLVFYLGLGWIGLLTGYKYKKVYKAEGFHWLWLGGVFYSIGAILEYFRWPTIVEGVVGPHEIFHIFVILGAVSHWVLIYRWAAHPVSNTILFHVKMFPDNFFEAHAQKDHLICKAQSVEELHNEVKIAVRQKYHESIPVTVRLIYFKEEHLSL